MADAVALNPEAKARALSQGEAEIKASTTLNDAEKKQAIELQKIWQAKDAKAGLDFGAMPPNSNLTDQALKEFAGNAIGTADKKDYLTKAPATLTPEERRLKDRYDELNKATRVIREIVESQYNAIDAEHNAQVRPQLQAAIEGYEPTNLIFSALTAAGAKEAFLDNFAKKSLFRIKVKEQADQVFKQESLPSDTEVTQIQQQYNTAEGEFQKVDEEVTTLGGEITNIETTLRLRAAGDPVDPRGTQRKVDDAVRMRDQYQAELSARTNPARGVDVATLRSVADIQRDLNTERAKVIQKQTQKQNEDDLVAKRRELAQKQKDKDAKEKNRDLLQKQFIQTLKLREQAEEALVKRTKDIFGNAAREVIREKSNSAEQEYLEELNKKIAEATDAEKKYLLGQLESRWDKVTGTGTDAKKELNKTEITKDYIKLVTEGPAGLVKNMLDDEEIEDPRNPGNKKKRRVLITARGVVGHDPRLDAIKSSDELIKENPDLVSGVQADIGKRLIMKAMQNKDFKHQHINIIAESKWGGDLINQAIAENKKINQAVDEYRKAQGLRGDWRYWGQTHKMLITKIVVGGLAGAWLWPILFPVGKAILFAPRS